jgi:hypothetical protein
MTDKSLKLSISITRKIDQYGTKFLVTSTNGAFHGTGHSYTDDIGDAFKDSYEDLMFEISKGISGE